MCLTLVIAFGSILISIGTMAQGQAYKYGNICLEKYFTKESSQNFFHMTVTKRFMILILILIFFIFLPLDFHKNISKT